MKNVISGILGAVSVAALLVITLITSFEIACYSDFGWYQKEYETYEVLDALDMEMEDVMKVTEEMMAYLRGDREDLVVDTVVSGQNREFFNDREKAHMEDVKELFLGGLQLRRLSVAVLVAALLVWFVWKMDWVRLLAKSCLIGVGCFLGLLGAFAALCATNFSKYFVVFHELFFDNDLWILNPKTDLLIRMLPEGFFFDMVVRIGVIFGIVLLGILLVSSVLLWKKKRNKQNL